MPNRILRDWTDSLRFDGLSAEAERLFARMIMKADDYGRFHAHPPLLKSACFPLAEDLRANTVATWLEELASRQLVFCYTSGSGKYLALLNFGQRLKQSRAKFPPPPGEPDDWLPTSGNFRELPARAGDGIRNRIGDGIRNQTETEPAGAVVGSGGFPTCAEVIAYGETVMASVECCEAFWNAKEGDGWTNKHGATLSDWKAVFRNWSTSWKANEARRKLGGNGTSKPQTRREREAEALKQTGGRF